MNVRVIAQHNMYVGIHRRGNCQRLVGGICKVYWTKSLEEFGNKMYFINFQKDFIQCSIL